MTKKNNKISDVELTDDHIIKSTVKLVVKFHGSLSDLSEDVDLTKWVVSTPEVFGVNTDDDERIEALSDAILIGAKIKKISSTFPCDINIDIKDIKNKSYMFKNGRSSHYVAYPRETNHSLDEVLLEPSEHLINSVYLKEHINYTPKRLTHDIIKLPNSNYSYVGKKNPIVKIINNNTEQFQMTLTSNDLVDDEHYKIENNVIDHCVTQLSEKLNKKLPMSNLNEFAVEISRSDGLEFNDPEGICDNLSSDDSISKVMKGKRDLNCVLEITYSLT